MSFRNSKMSSCKGSGFQGFGCVMGDLAALLFFAVQIPQIIQNHKRKSMEGFSPVFVFVRLLGLSFHVVNGIIEKITFPLIFASSLLLIEFLIFIYQFAVYENNKKYFLGFLIILPAIVISPAFPITLVVTDLINPVSQIACYYPLVMECIRTKSTRGVSLIGQHLNFSAAVFGLLMCTASVSCDGLGWVYYLISLGQSVTVYSLAIYYDEFKINNYSPISRPNNEIHIEQIDNDLDAYLNNE